MRITRILCLGLLGIAVGGCDVPAPRPIHSRQCVPVGAEPTNVAIRAPADGTVRVGVEPRGIAVVASIPARSGIPLRATSPVDRLGLITLVAPVEAGEVIAVRIESRDWREIRAEVCVDAVLLPRSDLERTRAERAFSRAGAATHERDWQRAFDSYDTAARGFARMGLNEPSGAARHAMSELAYMRLHRESDAVELAKAAMNEYGEHADRVTRGTLVALEVRATLEVRDVTDPEARAAVQELVDTARGLLQDSLSSEREVLRLAILEGFLAYRADSPERAESFFVQAMQDCRAANDWECHGTAAQNVALLAEARDSFAVALEAYEEAQLHLDSRVAPEQAADILDNMGRLQRVAGLVSASDVSHAAALRLYASLRDCDSVRRTLARLGALHAQVGSFDDAVFELQRAASLECRDLFEWIDNRGGVGSDSRPSQLACSGLLAPDRLSADGKLAVLQTVLALQDVSLLADDLDTAQRCSDHAHLYAATARGQVRTANARGTLFLERDQPGAARSAFEEARRVADAAELPPAYEQRSRTMLGLARASLLAGDTREAQRLGLEALRTSVARAHAAQVVDSLQLLAATLRAAERIRLASVTLNVAAELIERIPIDELDGDVRATYLASQHDAFAEHAEMLASAARDEETAWNAFAVVERGRARSFRYALTQVGERGGSADSSEFPKADHALLRRIAASLEDAGPVDLEDFVHRLGELAPETSSALARLEPRELRRRLAFLDATFVEYAVGPREMFAFVIDAKRIHVVPLGRRDAIARVAARLAEQLRDREARPDEVRSTAEELARVVWWPVVSFVDHGRLIVAPDDALHLVPFQVLPWSPASGTDLIVHHVETTIVPSALFIAHAGQATRSRDEASTLALIGDPVFRSAPWQQQCAAATKQLVRNDDQAGTPAQWTEWLPSLPSSRREVLEIAALARQARPGSRVETLLGCAATASALQGAARQRGTVVHIATHGRIDARRPRLSALALTPEADRPRDASFSLLDILDLELDARLVTLSACDTSNGRLLRGEGVLGPAQAFLQAGAASVVASYWRVADDTTARFMNAFYRRLLDQNMSAGEALRLTQLEEQKLGGSYSWAAFGLYGRPDTRI